jgi:hypothetical protein
LAVDAAFGGTGMVQARRMLAGRPLRITAQAGKPGVSTPNHIRENRSAKTVPPGVLILYVVVTEADGKICTEM